MSAKPTTNATPADVKAVAEEKVTVPAQQSPALTEAKAVDQALDSVPEELRGKFAEGYTAKVFLNPETNLVEVEFVEDGKAKVKGLAGKAKGVFQRNKKLVLATGGLLATSLLLKVLANRQAALEDDEVVESSDDVSVDA